MDKEQEIYDCIIIGGGPAGLTAALYLARFRRNVLLFDNNNSRASLIPNSNNFPTWPNGIEGKKILSKLRSQLLPYNIMIKNGYISEIEKNNIGLFSIIMGNISFQSKNIILATGTSDIHPKIDNIKTLVRKGLVRYCSICDAYEIIDKKIAVIGKGTHGFKEAAFLRNYTSNITLFYEQEVDKINSISIKEALKLGIRIINQTDINYIIKDNSIMISTKRLDIVSEFDYLYPALGSNPNSQLAKQVSAELNEDGYIVVDKNQTTSIKGLYAIGDVVEGLSQISVGIGQAAIAGTYIHNNLL